MISLHTNIAAYCANQQYQINRKNNNKVSERLSSGYRINRAADDAAGLAISEKMRTKIRALAQGTKNGQDGVSWNQTGDGALNEAHDILHRMTELTVKALNDPNTQSDRTVIDREYEQLKLELDRISKTTTFNEINIFTEHEIPFYLCEGGAQWDPEQIQVVTAPKNNIIFEYSVNEGDAPTTMTFTVPPGEYTTMELLDKLDDIFPKDNGDGTRFVMYMREGGFIDAALEKGEKIESVSGGLSYLLYDMYTGGNSGALIGTTIFPNENSRLRIVSGKNDDMTFDIEYFDGRSASKHITIPDGSYTRSELIDLLNNQLAGTGIEASPYGTGIKMGSREAIVTGFKGNMFKIDGGDYTSVFYDNVKYGSVSQTPANFKGGFVLTTDPRDVEHSKLVIDSTNNVLTLQPNSMENSVSLTIDEGEYTMEEMRDKLNSLFASNGLRLTASVITANVGLDKTITFKGLQIESLLKGPDSKVNLDPSSSAYNTLFVNREYNQYGTKATLSNESKQNKEATLTGGKNLNDISLSSPLALNSSNNTFDITIQQTGSSAITSSISLVTASYNSVNEIVNEINRQFQMDANMLDKITAEVDNGRIVLKGKEGAEVDSISVSSSSSAYDVLFQGTNITYTTTTTSGNGSITINTPGSANTNSMVIRVDGVSKTVTFPNSNPTKEQIEAAIDSQLQARESVSLNTFSSISRSGSNSDRNFSSSSSGSEVTTPWSGNEAGRSDKYEGRVEYKYNYPAVLELGPQLKSSMVLNSDNNTLRLSINGTTKDVVLDPGTYNQASFVTALQGKIDDLFGTGWGSVNVTRDGNQLVLTSVLPDGYDGKDTRISCGTDSSSLLKYLNTTQKPAECISNLALDSNIHIDGSCNTFAFQYNDGSGNRTVSLTLASGNYTPASMVSQINAQLAGTGVTASLSDGKLKLTSEAKGNGVSISYDTRTCGTAANALFGNLTSASKANMVIPREMQSNITIENDKNHFRFYVNGGYKDIALTPGNYTREGLVAELNRQLEGNGVDAQAYLSGNNLGFQTKNATGTGASLSVSYDSSGTSAMEAIYGSTRTLTPGVDASWNGNQLVLKVVDASGNAMGRNISVSSSSGGGLQVPQEHRTPVSPTSSAGYHSRKKSYLDGVNLGAPIEIDQWNNDLKFTFTDNGTPKNINLSVEDGSYNYDQLKEKLQQKIDAQVGADKIVVTVDASGVRLEAKNQGNQYAFSDPSGDFYDKIMCQCTLKTVAQKTTNKDGAQTVNQAYTIGRKDVLSQQTEIQQGISDEFSLDFTYGNTVHKISIKLDPGVYDGQSLKQQLQEKIDDKLEEMGLRRGVIEVGIGGINSGVYGGNDDKALNFSISSDEQAPAEGEVIIDGVSGNAAFEIFYQTDGKMIPAYIMGAKDITSGVTIEPSKGDLTFEVDGTEYTITLPEGDYSAEELLNTINDKFTAGGIPLTANQNYGDNRLKISHKDLDEHEFGKVSGGAKNAVFFSERGEKEEEDRYVRLSDASDDVIGLPKARYSTALMGIHSICVTKPEHAEKALERLKAANEYVSNLRSDFGSTQNRLEHALDNNRNKEENLQASESVIRDQDMAEAMVEYSKNNILLQAGEAMMAQANMQNQNIVNLLK